MSNLPPQMIVVLTVLALAVIYVAECLWWPFAACGKCKGKGRHMGPGGKVWRNCRRCQGSGRRLRVGRKAWNFVQRRREK